MNIGDKAPELLGRDENGRELRLSDFKGKKLVLYFYPKDSTSGCTAEACSLRDNYSELKKLGYAVVGVSVHFPDKRRWYCGAYFPAQGNKNEDTRRTDIGSYTQLSNQS